MTNPFPPPSRQWGSHWNFILLIHEVLTGTRSGPPARNSAPGLDALTARLHGLTESEFAHILSTSALVDESIKKQTRNTCRELIRLDSFA